MRSLKYCTNKIPIYIFNCIRFCFSIVFFTPIVTSCQTDISMTPPKVEDDGWLLIDVVNIKYASIIDLNTEELKQKYIKNKQGPVNYEKEPSIGMVLGMYVPTDLLKKLNRIQMIMWRRGGYWNRTIISGTRNISLHPLILNSCIICLI